MSGSRWLARLKKLVRQPRPVRFLVSRLMWRFGVSQFTTIGIGDGLRVRFYPSSVSAALWVSPDARNDDVDFLKLVLRPGDRYVDCGANIGHLAIVARSLVGSTGSVLAIEPNPRIFGYCKQNLQLNGFSDVETRQVALGAEAGETTITDDRSDDQNHVGAGSTCVRMETLDALAGSQPVLLLKLDVEGYELQVLRGAVSVLALTTIVYCELSDRNAARFGYQATAVEQMLLDSGFLLATHRDGAWILTSRTTYDSLGATDTPATGYNVLAIRHSEVKSIAARFSSRGQRLAEDKLV